MSETKPRCCRLVPSGFGRLRHFHIAECGRPAKVERDGKHYCGIHDPVKAAERAVKRDAKDAKNREMELAKWAAEREQDRRAECFGDLLSALEQCVGVLNEPTVTRAAQPYGVDYALQDARAALAKAMRE